MFEEKFWSYFFEIHHELAREAPGADSYTEKAWRMIPNLPDNPTVLDLGCGPGASSLMLAQLGAGHVLAVDLYEPYLKQLDRRALIKGFSDRIETRCADMASLELPIESLDVLWSEGALYQMGFRDGLTRYRPMLKPGGYVAVTEAVWLTDNPPQEAYAYWEMEYPDISNIQAKLNNTEDCGYSIIGHFTLPPKTWTDYYAAIEARLPAFRERYARNPEAQEVLSLHEREIEIFRRYGDSYGYEFIVARKQD
jgi:cyclopropane fatty-acyl-phospholipid synthase-like methyltransferase